MLEEILFSPFKLSGGQPVNLWGGNKVLFLSLHRVKNEVKPDGFNEFLDISTNKLKTLILHLKKLNAEFVTINDLEQQQDNKKIKVHFTLDDGYKDQLHHILPIFEQHKIPFTLFLTTGIPDREAKIWWYQLAYVFQNGLRLQIPSFNIDINAKNLNYERQLQSFEFLKKYFLENYSAFKSLIDEALDNAGAHNEYFLDSEGLNWKDIREMNKSNLCSIGSHSHHHYCLSKLNSQDIANEINYSLKRIKEETGVNPKHFAFPFGGKNDVADLSKINDVQIDYAFTAETGIIRDFKQQDRYSIPRYFINDKTTPFDINMVVNGMRHRANRLFNQ